MKNIYKVIEVEKQIIMPVLNIVKNCPILIPNILRQSNNSVEASSKLKLYDEAKNV